MKFALGMYTLHNEIKGNFEACLKAVKEAGYDGIEMFGEAPVCAKEFSALLDAYGLLICGWHTDWSLLKPDKIQETIEYNKIIGNNNIIIPALGGKFNIGHNQMQNCCEIWKRHAREINEISKRLSESGMRLGYHTHSDDFKPQFEGLSVWDIFLADTAPEVFLQLDTGNCLEGGGDVKKSLKEACDKLLSVHAKPFSPNGESLILGSSADKCNWKSILKLSQKGGASIIVIENEGEDFDDKFAVIKKDLDALKAYIKK